MGRFSALAHGKFLPANLILMRPVFTLFCLAFLCNSCNAQTPEQPVVTDTFDPYFIETTDTFSNHGPRSIVRDVMQDRRGIYWFASWQGIISYDGKMFTNHTLKDGLIHFHVFSAYEDRKGQLWFGTVRGGLYRYDGRRFTLFTTRDGLADNTVNCMVEDRAGNIWFGTPAGASRFDGRRFTTFTTADGLADSCVESILADSRGLLWFGCRSCRYGRAGGGIVRYNGKTFTPFLTNAGTPFTSISALHEARDGTIWIGRMDGLSRYDPSADERDALTDYAHHSIGYIIEDKQGNIWLSGNEPNTHGSKDRLPYNGVLLRYDGKNFIKAVEKYEPGDSQVFGMAEDRDGNILFGTMHGGCKWDGKTGTVAF